MAHRCNFVCFEFLIFLIHKRFPNDIFIIHVFEVGKEPSFALRANRARASGAWGRKEGGKKEKKGGTSL
jgi:hypothetical protein